MKVHFHQSPTIGRGWWWEIRPTGDEIAALGLYGSGYAFTLWGAKRGARRLVRRLREKDADFSISPDELLGKSR